MANITKYLTSRGETRYRVRYRKPDGSQTDKRGFHRKLDAERWAAEHVTVAKAEGRYVDPVGGRRLVSDLYDQWLAERRPFWKPATAANIANAWTVHVEPRWAGRRIGDVTQGEVQAWVGGIIEKSGHPSARRPYGVLSGVCGLAVRDKLIPANPCDGVELPKLPARKERRVYLTIPRLLAFADEASNCRVLGDERRALVLLLGFCGLRWGEAAGLRVGDLDLDAGVLHVRRNLVYVGKRDGWVEGTPKSHERRDVPLPHVVRDALKTVCADRGPEERVFRDAHGGPIRKQSLARENGWWVRTLTRLGWERNDWPVPHDLRHTAASLAVHAGANVKALQRMLGHKNASMTLDVYADLFDSDLMDVARLLDAAVQVEARRGDASGKSGQNVGKPVVKERGRVGIPGE